MVEFVDRLEAKMRIPRRRLEWALVGATIEYVREALLADPRQPVVSLDEAAWLGFSLAFLGPPLDYHDARAKALLQRLIREMRRAGITPGVASRWAARCAASYSPGRVFQMRIPAKLDGRIRRLTKRGMISRSGAALFLFGLGATAPGLSVFVEARREEERAGGPRRGPLLGRPPKHVPSEWREIPQPQPRSDTRRARGPRRRGDKGPREATRRRPNDCHASAEGGNVTPTSLEE